MGDAFRGDDEAQGAYWGFLVFLLAGVAVSIALSTRFDHPLLVSLQTDPLAVAAKPLLVTSGVLGFVGSLAMGRNAPLWGAYLALAAITWFALPGFVFLIFPVTFLALVMLVLHQGNLLIPAPPIERGR